MTESGTWATMADRMNAGNTQQQSLVPKLACNSPARALLQRDNAENISRENS